MLGREEWLLTGKKILQLLVQIDKPSFKRALKKAHSDEEKPNKEKFDIDETNHSLLTINAFEVERSVFPSVSNFIEHLDEHLWKSFQKLDHTDLEYIQRIQDENALLFIVDKVADFFTSFEQ